MLNNDEKEILPVSHLRDHMANERTFLAWIRTSIGIMAFGFVVEKFSLFMQHISPFLEKENPLSTSNLPPSPHGYSSFFGILLVVFGIFVCLLAFIKFKSFEKQIDTSTYRPGILLDVMIALSVVLIGFFLLIYMGSLKF